MGRNSTPLNFCRTQQAVSRVARDAAAAKALVKFLAAAENTAAISARGYERVNPWVGSPRDRDTINPGNGNSATETHEITRTNNEMRIYVASAGRWRTTAEDAPDFLCLSVDPLGGHAL